MNYTATAVFIVSIPIYCFFLAAFRDETDRQPPYRPKRLWALLTICSAFMFAYVGIAAVYVVQLSFPEIIR